MNVARCVVNVGPPALERAAKAARASSDPGDTVRPSRPDQRAPEVRRRVHPPRQHIVVAHRRGAVDGPVVLVTHFYNVGEFLRRAGLRTTRDVGVKARGCEGQASLVLVALLQVGDDGRLRDAVWAPVRPEEQQDWLALRRDQRRAQHFLCGECRRRLSLQAQQVEILLQAAVDGGGFVFRALFAQVIFFAR